MKSFFSSTLFSSLFARGDPFSSETGADRDPLPTLPSSAAPSTSPTWRSDAYSNAAMLLHSGSVDAFVTQHALTPSSAWWLR
jgi:hypothetical protein